MPNNRGKVSKIKYFSMNQQTRNKQFVQQWIAISDRINHFLLFILLLEKNKTLEEDAEWIIMIFLV